MRRTIGLTGIIILSGLLAYALGVGAHAADCSNPQREDLKAICSSDELSKADRIREDTVALVTSSFSDNERSGLEAFEQTWLFQRNALCPFHGDAIDAPCLLTAINEHTAELKSLFNAHDVATGRLHFRYIKPSNSEPNFDVHVNVVEFESPRTPGETLFNAQIESEVALVPMSSRYSYQERQQHWLDVISVYRSKELISERLYSWICCGAHGSGGMTSVNVDLQKGKLFVPRDTLHLGYVANLCWRKFADDEELNGQRGPEFASKYPLTRAFEDSDLEDEIRTSNTSTRDLFSGVLTRPDNWSFGHATAEIWFGTLISYPTGQFTCKLTSAELRSVSKVSSSFFP